MINEGHRFVGKSGNSEVLHSSENESNMFV